MFTWIFRIIRMGTWLVDNGKSYFTRFAFAPDNSINVWGFTINRSVEDWLTFWSGDYCTLNRPKG